MVFWHQGWGLVYHCLWPHKVPRDTKAWNVKPIKVKIRSQTFRQNFPLRRNISTTTSIEYKWILQCFAVSRGKSWKKKIYFVKVFCVWMQVFDTLNPRDLWIKFIHFYISRPSPIGTNNTFTIHLSWTSKGVATVISKSNDTFTTSNFKLNSVFLFREFHIHVLSTYLVLLR